MSYIMENKAATTSSDFPKSEGELVRSLINCRELSVELGNLITALLAKLEPLMLSAATVKEAPQKDAPASCALARSIEKTADMTQSQIEAVRECINRLDL